jgi:hypothetical protein
MQVKWSVFKAHFETCFLKLYYKRTQIHGKTNTSKMMMITKWTEDEWLNKLMEDDCVNKTPSQLERLPRFV